MRQRIGIHRFPPQSKTQEEHMKTRKLTAVLLALIMAFAVLPAAAFAESIEGIAAKQQQCANSTTLGRHSMQPKQTLLLKA